MAGQQIGYIRASSFDQNPERQLDGAALDRVFTDKASGKDVNRPQLETLILKTAVNPQFVMPTRPAERSSRA